MSSSSALALASPSGAIVPIPNVSTAAGLSASFSISVRLDAHNFMLWRGLTVTTLVGAVLHGHLDGTATAPTKTIKEGTGDAAVDVPNPEYSRWWVMDERVLGFFLGFMEPIIACQLIGCMLAMDVWAPCTDCTARRVAPTFIMFVANSSPFARKGYLLPSICSR
jgi:hydrogenase/urease accessory protein HupE